MTLSGLIHGLTMIYNSCSQHALDNEKEKVNVGMWDLKLIRQV
jgi:hypothetical protein